MDRAHTIRNADQLTKCAWSPWDGVTVRGCPVRTWVMGQPVYANGLIDDTARGTEVRFDHSKGGYWATTT